MAFELSYGDQQVLHLDVPAETVLLDGSRPHGQSLADPAAAVGAALAAPLDYPPISKATVPGDRIVLAIEQGIPELQSIVAGIVHHLIQCGASPDRIELVLDPCASPASMRQAVQALPDSLRRTVRATRHDPRDSNALCYLAASEDGRPIYFNRRICEADVVIPLGTLRLEDSFGYLGIHHGLFPTFSDHRTRARFLAPSNMEWAEHGKRRRAESNEAAWLLGVQLTVQVAPGANGSVLAVLAGQANAVAERGRQICEASWRHRVAGPATFVVAAVGGGTDQQTWANVARALFVADQAVTDGGVIVLCTSLSQPPGPALSLLAAEDRDDDCLRRALHRERSEDALPAMLFSQISRRARLYLLSSLEMEAVEDLGIGGLEAPHQVQHLSEGHQSCILLGDAQHAMLKLGQFELSHPREAR